MENGKWRWVRGQFTGKRAASPFSTTLGCACISLLAICGCAAPGVPIARMPAVAPGITDLAARQRGEDVVLTFTLPKETVQGRPLEKTPEIDIYREFLPASSETAQTGRPPSPEQLALRLDSQAASQERNGEGMRVPVPLSAEDIAAHAGNDAIFSVRTRISSRDSADSNLAEARILPPPEMVQNLTAQVTKKAVELSWSPVEAPSTAALGPASIRYRVYRRQERQAAAASTSAGAAGNGVSESEFTLLGESQTAVFNDANFTFGETYAYVVRSAAQYDSGEVESEDSKPLEVTPRDTFPPAAPMGLVAAVIPATQSEGAQVDLSWAISPETDIAGYNVYRSDAESTPGEKLNSELLLTPTFRDASAELGHSYFYKVTAVDRSGNESERSAALPVTVPASKDRGNAGREEEIGSLMRGILEIESHSINLSA
jgi:hypothetical protein